MSRHLIAPLSALVFLAVGLYGCSKPSEGGKEGKPTASASAATAPSAATSPAASAAAPATGDGTITIATFSIQKFDQKKADTPAILTKLAAVVRKYDVVAIQGIRDEAGGVAKKLLAEVNQGQRGAYGMVVSEPTGREKNDERYQERYAFFHRTTRIDAFDDGQLFDDSADDHFPREPFAASFGVKGSSFNFVLITVRTIAKRTLKEMAALPKVFAWAQQAYADQDDFLLLGDLNADCRHAMPEQLEALDLRTAKYKWVIPDDSDSNVGEASCAYDRMIITEGAFDDYAGQWGVDRAFTDEAVSDRWPVWTKWHPNKDKG